MKRIALWSLAAVLGTGFVAAQETTTKDHSMKSELKAMTASGIVTKVDDAGKVLSLKDSKGKEVMIGWNDSTKVTGTLAPGSMASVEYMTVDGKMVASSVKVTDKPKM